MPLKSRSQMRWMFATHPKMAKRWAEHTPDIKALPEHAEQEKKSELVECFNKIAKYLL
jgi:hypothetical protein